MAITIVCECGRKTSAKDEHAGKRGKCPACQRVIEIPLPFLDQPAVSAVIAQADGSTNDADRPLTADTGKHPRRFRKQPSTVIGTGVMGLVIALCGLYLATARHPTGDYVSEALKARATVATAEGDYVSEAVKARAARAAAEKAALVELARELPLTDTEREEFVQSDSWESRNSRFFNAIVAEMPRDPEGEALLKRATQWYKEDVIAIWADCDKAAWVIKRGGKDADARRILEGSIEVMERLKIFPRSNQDFGHYAFRYRSYRGFGQYFDPPYLDHQGAIDYIVSQQNFVNRPVNTPD